MGLSLKPLGNILHAIETPVVDVGKAIGDAGSYVAGAVTGNQQAQANASKAFQNAFTPVSNIVQAPIRATAGAGVGLFTDLHNLLNHTNLTTPQLLQQNPNPLANALDTYATNHNTNQNLGKATTLAGNVVQPVAAALFGPEEKAITGTLEKGAGSLLAKSGGRIGAGALTGAGFGGGQALTAPNPTVGSVAGGAAEGAAVGGITSGATLARPVIKALKNTPDAAVDTAKTADPATTTNLEQAGQQAAETAKLNIPQRQSLVSTPDVVNPTATPVAKPTVALPIPRSNTGFPEIDKAINDVADQYSNPGQQRVGNIDQVLEQTKGQERLGTRLSQKLGAVIKKEFSPAENRAIDDALDGNITQDLTPEAAQVANALQPLLRQGLDVRQAIKPDTGQVEYYSPRVEDNTLNGSVARGASKLQSIGSKLNLSSGFSEARVNNKFISRDSTLIGNPKQLGLTDKGNGNFADESGKIFKVAHATKDELEQAGVGVYARRASTVNRVYHTDTLGLKARAETIKELQDNPNNHGLYTEDQVNNGVAPSGVRPVAGVKELDGLYASDKDAHQIQDRLGFTGSATPAPLRAFDAVTNAVTQFIVLNPIFHGVNQLYQTALAAGNLPGLKGLPGHGFASVLKSMMTLNEDDIRAVLEAGAGGSDYGASLENILSKMTGGATKVSAKTMAALEVRFRAALYKSSLEKNMSKADAVDNINTFLGSTKHVNETARRAILFAHYLRTMTGAMGHQLRHPIEERGSIVNAVTMAAVGAALSYGYAKMTGNPNAKVRVGGEVGLAESLYSAGKDAVQGNTKKAGDVIIGRINPVIKEGVQQAIHKDAFTGQDISNDRLGHAASSLVSPVAIGGKVTQGKRTAAETIANELGLSTPHAKGYQAAPKLSFLNKPGAITSPTGDPTGYRQQQSYFNNLDNLKKTFAGSDQATQDSLNKFLDRSHDPVTGQAIKNSPADTVENSGALATNDKLRAAVQKFEQSQPSHDPMWDLSPDKLQYLMTYKAQLEGSAERNVLKAEATDPNTGDNWIDDLTKAQQDFYNNLPKIPGAKAPEDNPNTPAYPTFDQQTTDLLAAYNSATPDQRSQLIKDNPGELATAFNAIAQWTNQMRKAQTGKDTPQLNIYPEASPAVQKIIDTYNAIPKGGGSKGGNLFRAQWIKANPDAYAQMQNYLSQTSMYSLIKNAALAQFQGTTASQQLLKDIKNVGTFDIATSKDAKGQTTYSINPATAFAQSSGGSGSSAGLSAAFNKLKASVKQSSQERDLEHAARAARRVAPKNHSYPKRDKVFIKGTPQVTRQKIALPGVTRKYTPKIKLKAAPSGNKVRLKVH